MNKERMSEICNVLENIYEGNESIGELGSIIKELRSSVGVCPDCGSDVATIDGEFQFCFNCNWDNRK